jgi:hypothetical protein
MPIPVVPKSNATPGFAPLPADIRVGELALNTADAVLYCKNADGEIVPLTSTSVDGGGGPLDAGTYYGAVAGKSPFNVTAKCYENDASSGKYIVSWEMPDQPCAGTVVSYRLEVVRSGAAPASTGVGFTDDGVVVNPPT